MRFQSNVLFLLLCLIKILVSQEIPPEFKEYQELDYKFDQGENWFYNTNLGSYRFQDINSADSIEGLNPRSLYIDSKFGYIKHNSSNGIYVYMHFTFKKYFYGYLYPRLVSDNSTFPRYSGIKMPKSRAGFISGETDLSGIGFQNDWLLFQIGRGRESWGAGNDINILLSDNVPPYDYFMIGSRYNRLKVRYFHGFLESNQSRINRYINGKGIEWNDQNLILSLSEVIIYSGENRPLDFAYINPISSHLEVELNDRLNLLGTESANAVWQISSDWRPINKIRFSSNFVVDEFVLDKEEKDAGKNHGTAYSFRLSYSPFISNSILTFHVSSIYVGTNTFRHYNGNNNFINRNKPLGWIIGSDAYENGIGLNYLFKRKLLFKLNYKFRAIGEGNINYNPYIQYDNYWKGDFPSGIVDRYNLITFDFNYFHKDNIEINGKSLYKINFDQANELSSWIGVNIFFRFKKVI